MSRMTKRMRDQLNDITMARRKKEGKPTYSKAQLAAVAAVTARLEEGLRPQPAREDFTSFFTQTVRSQARRLYADIAKRNTNMLVQVRAYSTRAPVAGYDLTVDPLDDIQKDCISRADDMVATLKFGAYPRIMPNRDLDFGVIRCSGTI